jgi:hypothetical protein
MARGFDPNRKVMGSGHRRRASRAEPWTLEAKKTAFKGDVASIQSLLMAIQEEGDPGIKRQATNLISKLQAAIDGNPDADTLASKIVIREVRKLWVKHVRKLVRMSRGYPISFMTVFPESLELTDEEFAAFDADAAKKAFKSLLNRRGIAKCKGWLLAALHGEYDSVQNQWRIHWHMLVCHEMIKVIDGLRTEKNFKTIKGRAPRVKRTHLRLVNIPRLASYLLQAWWPNRPTGKFGDLPFGKRTDHRMEIRGPQKVAWLIWMNQRKLSDLVMLIGLRRTQSGFKMTQL